jgi:hypothetical protein
MKWVRLAVAGYAALLVLGLASLAALGVLEPLALKWTALQVAIGLGLGVLIVIATSDRGKPRTLRHGP